MRPTRLAYVALLCLPFSGTAAWAATDADPSQPAPPGVVGAPAPAQDVQAPQAVAPPPAPPKPVVPTLVAKVDLTTQMMTVAEHGKPLYTWRVSSGRDGFPTPKGTFRAEWVAKMWYSRQYDMAPMPFAVFFKNGAAIHGTSAVGQLGSPASHGCVRLTSNNAQTFYKLVNKHGLAATKIIVQGNPPVERVARNGDRSRDEDRRRRRNDDGGYAAAYGSGYGYGYGYQPPPRYSRYEPEGTWPWGGASPRYRAYERY